MLAESRPKKLPRPTASNGGSDLGAGIMYLPVIGSLSFILWYVSMKRDAAHEADLCPTRRYLPLYKAMQTGYSFFFCECLL